MLFYFRNPHEFFSLHPSSYLVMLRATDSKVESAWRSLGALFAIYILWQPCNRYVARISDRTCTCRDVQACSTEHAASVKEQPEKRFPRNQFLIFGRQGRQNNVFSGKTWACLWQKEAALVGRRSLQSYTRPRSKNYDAKPKLIELLSVTCMQLTGKLYSTPLIALRSPYP